MTSSPCPLITSLRNRRECPHVGVKRNGWRQDGHRLRSLAGVASAAQPSLSQSAMALDSALVSVGVAQYATLSEKGCAAVLKERNAEAMGIFVRRLLRVSGCSRRLFSAAPRATTSSNPAAAILIPCVSTPKHLAISQRVSRPSPKSGESSVKEGCVLPPSEVSHPSKRVASCLQVR